jgi:predicted nucleic acid-binding protein
VVSVYFLDSSVLVKRYVTEIGTTWVQQLADPHLHNQLIIARIAWVEVLSAFARRQREGSFSSTDTAKAIQTFRYDLDMQYQVVELNQALAEAAGRLVTRHSIRAYDAVQLASALHLQAALAQTTPTPLTLLSADDRLIPIAQAEGLLTDNPNHHT